MVIAILTLSFSLLPTLYPAQALSLVPSATGEKCDAGDATKCGNYTLNDFVVLAVNVSKIILGLVGSLSLLMFIYGGFTFLISAGSSDKIGQAKKIIVAAIIGLIIVFTSWMIINFVTKAIGARGGFIFNGTVPASGT